MMKNKQNGFISILAGGIITLLALFSVGAYLTTNEGALNVGGNSTIGTLPIKTFLNLTDTPNSYFGQGSKVVSVKSDASGLEFTTGGGSMVYPDAGIALSTGSAWGTSITNNSSNWNTAYGWGNHASAGYLTSLSGALLATGATTGATSQAQTFTNGIIAGNNSPTGDYTLTQNSVVPFTSVFTGAVANTLYLKTGNVGIGTTGPQANLHVVGVTGIRVENTSPTFTMYDTTGSVNSRNWALYGSDVAEGDLGFKVSAANGGDPTVGTSVLYMNKSGNVGIGTTSPASKLHVYDTTAVNAAGQEAVTISGLMAAGTVGSGPKIQFREQSSGSVSAAIRAYTFGSGLTGLAFDTGFAANSTRMVVDNNGNVGIGTTSPTSLLNIKAGTASVAPFQLTSGTVLTTPLAGVIEFNSDAFYGTTTTGPTRKQFAFTDSTMTGLWNGTAIDISSYTNLAAGRSLTLSGDSVEADAELYTDTKCIYWENPVDTDDFKSIWFAKQAATITSIWAESDQTVTFMLQVDDGSPADVDSVDLAPAAGTAEDTSMDGDATLASGDRLDMAVTSVSGTPTWASVCWTYTKDD